MFCSTRAGDGWLWAVLGLILLLARSDESYRALSASTLAVSAGVTTFLFLKRVFRRSRPCDVERHCWGNLAPPDRFSFPSGHTITAFAVAVSIGWFYPSALSGLLACAVMVALSRIFLGMHFLSDVLAGAAIGSGLAYWSCRLVESTRQVY
jgi:undecaprenyl-diphosphatase